MEESLVGLCRLLHVSTAEACGLASRHPRLLCRSPHALDGSVAGLQEQLGWHRAEAVDMARQQARAGRGRRGAPWVHTAREVLDGAGAWCGAWRTAGCDC